MEGYVCMYVCMYVYIYIYIYIYSIVSNTSYTVFLSQASQDLYVCSAVSSHVLGRKTKTHAWVEKVRLPSGGGHAGDMRGTCRGHAGDMQGACRGQAGDKRGQAGDMQGTRGTCRGTCRGHAGDMRGTCRGHAGDMQGTCTLSKSCFGVRAIGN